MSRIGLTGAHRTGKTTLAKAWAEQQGVEFVTLSTSQAIADMGMTTRRLREDPAARLELQLEMVRRCSYLYFQPSGSFISDRTPLDVAAYTMADAVEGFYSAEQWRLVEQIVQDCIAITNDAFHCLLMLRPEPSIGYAEENGKPSADMAYQAHHDLLVQGLIREEGMNVSVQKMRKGRALSLEERLATLAYINREIMADRLQGEIALMQSQGHAITVQ